MENYVIANYNEEKTSHCLKSISLLGDLKFEEPHPIELILAVKPQAD